MKKGSGEEKIRGHKKDGGTKPTGGTGRAQKSPGLVLRENFCWTNNEGLAPAAFLKLGEESQRPWSSTIAPPARILG